MSVALLFSSLVPLVVAELHEEVVRIPIGACTSEQTSRVCSLEAALFLPDGSGPFPLAVLSHGASGGPDRSPRWRPVEHAHWYTDAHFAVVVPMRRGNAASDGDWAEGFGACDQADFVKPSYEAAKDLRATLAFLRSRKELDLSRVVLVGVSAGGFASLAAGDVPGVRAVVNFAGGRGSLTDDRGETRSNCSPDALVAATKQFGRSIKVPTFWLYAENDKFFPPALAHRMFDAFIEAGGRGHFIALPPFGRDGHNVTWRPAAIPVWAPVFAPILRDVSSMTH
jgi:dienelactone hydrolase